MLVFACGIKVDKSRHIQSILKFTEKCSKIYCHILHAVPLALQFLVLSFYSRCIEIGAKDTGTHTEQLMYVPPGLHPPRHNIDIGAQYFSFVLVLSVFM